MRYAKTFVARWTECDVNGHLRSTTYSEYGIETRVAFLAENGFPFARLVELGIGPVVLREEIDFLHEVRLGEAVDVDVQQLGLSPDGARFKMAHEIVGPGGKRAARIVLLGAWMDVVMRKLTPPPSELTRAMGSVDRGEGYQDLPPLKRS